MTEVGIRPMITADWPAVERIYAEGIATGHATFDAEPPTWETFDAGKLPDLRLVATDERDEVVGWAAASPVSARAVYRGVTSTRSTSPRPPADVAPAVGSSQRSSTLRTRPECGRCSPRSSRRTLRACTCMNGTASASSAPANASPL